ncbi:hypothetical protein C8F04DRAFT_200277 [Mycena alexandri]|uniref:Uncharacterized protein n=1 Tax=Mycena alexandri TaxID=1745969 RepID=A0AAD6TH68_9AGAR|nr:hypothetical protein C8F04DRAFT_200277 [Mycena alexandri]
MPLPSSPSLHSFQIIVSPPSDSEEPQNFVIFDANDLPEQAPDFSSLDDALARMHTGPPPTFSRTSVDGSIVMPRRGDTLPDTDVADETVRDDSEIIEVVKVRRAFSQEEAPPLPPPPKPKSLKSRAGNAFRSIKNLARVASRSNNRPYAQEVFASSQSTQATFATVPDGSSPPPPLSRRASRGSIILTQLFRAPSESTVDRPAPTSTLDFLASEPYSDDDDDREPDADDRESIVRERASSPSPSTRTFSSTVRRRLSILSFRKPRAAPPRSPSPPTLSRGSTVPSASSSAPQTPTEESYPPPPPISKDADDPDRTLRLEDMDLTIGEMRLDSLHFESLSFDADNF